MNIFLVAFDRPNQEDVKIGATRVEATRIEELLKVGKAFFC